MNQKYILIADDVEENFLLLQTIFNCYEIESIWAENGLKAIELVSTIPEIILVIMDIEMPEMDGIAATRKIRTMSSNLPIIIHSANLCDNIVKSSFDAGCNDFIKKPIDKARLMQIINQYL